MKKAGIISILFITIGLRIVAQNQTYTQMFDSLFTNVSYGAVVSGILYDRVANMSDLELYNAAFDTPHIIKTIKLRSIY